MKKILFLAAFVLLGVTVTSCEVTNNNNQLANNAYIGTDDNPIPDKPQKPTPPPPPPTIPSVVKGA
ncbi:hypothetical protein GR160_11950 [Flavobacterium sp. Sd200]|uniref:hypothetical protein n=1 Tax=Flavobacterium sp. Sd200 TaxID=2692211 RepID=UPI001367FD05|nr:hypothetical protein [Flavobacterium sp. Sd200]MXN91937.1 hypothetical protein [Flavobacterium sp. Sd200]